MPEDDRQYYVPREAKERSIAEMISDGRAKAAHRELARQYANLADARV